MDEAMYCIQHSSYVADCTYMIPLHLFPDIILPVS